MWSMFSTVEGLSTLAQVRNLFSYNFYMLISENDEVMIAIQFVVSTCGSRFLCGFSIGLLTLRIMLRLGVLYYRAYAVWGCPRKLAIFLIVIYLVSIPFIAHQWIFVEIS